MSTRILSILFFLFLGSCSTISRGYKLSNFSFNGKKYNNYIVNRTPNYGYASADGCIIMEEISLNLLRSNERLFTGLVKAAKSKESLKNAVIKVFFANQIDALQIASDSTGHFQFIKNSNINRINVSSLGYRTLEINLEGNKFLQ